MNLSADYFHIAREEEKNDQLEAAFIHYISSLLSGLCSGELPYQATEKIRRLQNRLLLSDKQLLSCVHSYGAFSATDCRELLRFSIAGDLVRIENILSSRSSSKEDL